MVRVFVDGACRPTNLNKATCQLCGRVIKSGEGTRYRYCTGSWGDRYICRECGVLKPVLCACGCGEAVSLGRTYKQHHIFRIYSKFWEVRESKKGVKNVAKRPEVRIKLKSQNHSLEERQAASKRMKENNPMFNLASIKKCQNKILLKIDDFRKSVSRGVIRWHKDNPQIAEAQRRRWADKEWREDTINKIFKASFRRPTSIEQKLIDLCELNKLPFKYVGSDSQTTVNGLKPDFINTIGLKQIIEVFGRFWHQPEDEFIKPLRYSEVGFKCLVIWEEEFDNMDELLNKVKEFAG